MTYGAAYAESVRARYGFIYVKREYADEMKFEEAKPLYRAPRSEGKSEKEKIAELIAEESKD